MTNRTHLPTNKSNYNHFACILKNKLRKHNSESYQHYITTLLIFLIITNLYEKQLKACLRIENHPSPLHLPDDSLAISNSEKANLFASHLAKNFSPYPDIYILLAI